MHAGTISAANLPTGGLEICVRWPHAGHGIRRKNSCANTMTVETIDTFILRLAFGFTSTVLLLLFLLIVTGFSTLSFA
jgi:hypothetical protein